MNLFRKFTPLDLTAGTTLVVLFLVIGGVITYSNWLGVFVTLHTINPIDAISPYETLTLVFSQPVRPNDVENQMQLQPSIPGKLEWQDDHTAHFIPVKPYQGNLVVHLVPGKLGANGEWLRKDISWQLTIRQPLIVYLNYGEPKLELMTVPVTGGMSKQLTFSGGNIFDFNTSPSGDYVVYSVLNEQKGMDLWLVGRNGDNPRKLLDCGASRCSSPAWSPDGKLMAYTREAAGITPDSPTGVARPRLLDIETGDDRPLFSDAQAIGFGTLWSPDGNWLATYDGVNAQIRVVNLKSGQQVSIPSSLGMLGSWSPDSVNLIYPNLANLANPQPNTLLYRADFKSGEIGVFLGKETDEDDYSYGVPAWSPTGDQVVVSMRGDPQKPERQLWVISPDSLGGPIIAREPGYTYDFYQWDPWGAGLVYQQASLGKAYFPETVVWYPLQEPRVIAANTMFPHWLP